MNLTPEQQNVFDEMRREAFRLQESAKTPSGKLSESSWGVSNRSLSYKISGWIMTLEETIKEI